MGSKPRKEIAKDLESLRRDVSSLADQLTGLLSDKGDDIAGDVKQRVQRIRDDIEEGISQASAKGLELARSVSTTLRQPAFEFKLGFPAFGLAG